MSSNTEVKILLEELSKLDLEIRDLSLEYRASKSGGKGQLMDKILENITEAREMVEYFLL